MGLTFRNLDEFGLMYKFGNQKAMWRINLLSISKDKFEKSGTINDLEDIRKGFEFSFGREYRKILTPELELRYGLDFFYEKVSKEIGKELSYDDVLRSCVDEESSRFSGFQFVLGLNYNISEKLILGVEALPRWGWRKDTKLINSVEEYSETSYENYGEKKYTEQYIDEKETELKSSHFNLSSSMVMLSVAYRF